MSTAAEKRRCTPDEYLALERKVPFKREYYRGETFAKSGASREHGLIASNLGGEINRQLRDRRCEAYSNDMRVLVDATGLYTYPDITVACEEPRFLDAKVDTLLNPTLIVEVLSPSTERYDRGKKFASWPTSDARQIESATPTATRRDRSAPPPSPGSAAARSHPRP
jgi:Uma2 family endonuclease